MIKKNLLGVAVSGALMLGVAGGALAAGATENYVMGPDIWRALGEQPPANVAEPATPAANLGGGEESFLSQRREVQVNLFQSHGFRAGALSSYPAAEGFSAGGGAVGAFAEYNLDSWRVTTSALRGTGMGQGSRFAVSLGYGAKISSNISLSVGPSLSWQVGGAGEDLFSGRNVDPSLQGTLARRELEGSSKDLGASVVVNWHFLDSWNLTGVAGAKQQLSSDGETSMPDTRDAVRFYTGISVGYRF